MFYNTYRNEHLARLELIGEQAYHFISRTAGRATLSTSKLYWSLMSLIYFRDDMDAQIFFVLYREQHTLPPSELRSAGCDLGLIAFPLRWGTSILL